MLHSWTRSERGQTEPIAALVAVSAVVIALSLFAVMYVDAMGDGQSDRELAGKTSELVWNEVEPIGQSGVYDTAEVTLSADITREVIPKGYNVNISVTVVDEDGHIKIVDGVEYDAAGDQVSLDPPPSEATSQTRPIPVRMDPGDVQVGTLHVYVWDTDLET